MSNPSNPILTLVTCPITGKIFLNPIYGPNSTIIENVNSSSDTLCEIMKEITQVYLRHNPDDKSKVFDAKSHAESKLIDFAAKMKSNGEYSKFFNRASKILEHRNFNISVEIGNPWMIGKLCGIIFYANRNEIIHIIERITYDPSDDKNLIYFCMKFLDAMYSPTSPTNGEDVEAIMVSLSELHPIIFSKYMTDISIHNYLYDGLKFNVKNILFMKGFRYCLATVGRAIYSTEPTNQIISNMCTLRKSDNRSITSLEPIYDDDMLDSLVEVIIGSKRGADDKLKLINEFALIYPKRV